MIWIFLACLSGSAPEVESEEAFVIDGIQDKVYNIGDQAWSYPSTGLVMAFDERNPQFIKARELFNQQKISEAGEILISLINNEPQNPAYHSLLSSVMLSLGDVNQAKIAALEALKLHPAAITHVNLATVYHANNEFELAEEHYNKAHHFAPKFFLPLRNLSSLRYHSGDLREAEKYLRALMKIESDDSYAYVSLAQVLTEQNRLLEAREILEYRIQELQWVDESERATDSGMMLDLPLILGEIYRRGGDSERAIYWFEYTIDQGGKINSSMNDEIRYQVEATTRLIDIYVQQGRLEEAKERFWKTQKLITKEDLERKKHLEAEMSRLELVVAKLDISLQEKLEKK